MPKIVLQYVYLVNWYGFTNTKIPISPDLTLITGENECGKSTILDAVKYAFTGDSEFNKSSSVHKVGGSRRTLSSYTRCLIDPSAGTYARPVEKMPNVYSHISLEYYDEVEENFFVLGVILETNSSNNVMPYWYAMDKTRMDDIEYVYKDTNQLKPYDYQRFQKRYGIQMMSRKDAMTKFMQMTGLKIPYPEISKFQRKLRSIMTYNPAAKIQEFIKESVLEAKDVNFDKLIDAKNNIERINRTLEGIKDEVEVLDKILKDFAEYEKVASRLAVDDAKIVYKELKRICDAIEKDQTALARNKIELKQLKKDIDSVTVRKGELEDTLLEARSNLRELDCTKAIEDEEQKLAKYQVKAQELTEQKKELHFFQKQISRMLETLQELEVQVANRDILEQIETDACSAVEKEAAIHHLRSDVSGQRDALIEQRGLISNQLKEVQAEINHFNAIIEICNKNKPDYSQIKEQLAFIEEVNREFKKRNIDTQARLACDYVVELADEAWREAIEAFLGVHRYGIIVEPQYFDIANQVLDRSTHKYIELVNTRLLVKKKLNCVPDAVLNKLVIKNEIAKSYFTYWLGRIHAVNIAEVPEHENAMSKEGKLSRNMAVTFINTRKIKTFCLGQEAIALNKQRAWEQVKELELREAQILAEQELQRGQTIRLEEYLNCFGEYNYNAYIHFDLNQRDINITNENLRQLLKAQEDNQEYQRLNEQVVRLDEAVRQARERLNRYQGEKSDLESDSKRRQENLVVNERKQEQKEEMFDSHKAVHPMEVKLAIKQYDEYSSGMTKDGDTMSHERKSRVDRRMRELIGIILGGQKEYNHRKQEADRLPEGLAEEGKYLARKNKIWVDDLQDVNAKMTEQTRKYESVFKNEFVLTVYQTALEAKQDIAGINRELRKLKFATKYQFDVNLLDDKSEYAKILRYAEYLKKTNKVDDGQLVFGNLYGYENDEIEIREREIKEIINRIIDKNDLGVIKSFADYRNYMSYEIIINNAEVKDGRLSKQAGYNSGAGTQIPYTLILSAALSMLYNARVNSTRLIFIDEPFEKMSDHNIKLMLEFFKNQEFQVIFCAPPNKTDSIGYECSTIIPVIKLRNDNMQIGSVEFYERG